MHAAASFTNAKEAIISHQNNNLKYTKLILHSISFSKWNMLIPCWIENAATIVFHFIEHEYDW